MELYPETSNLNFSPQEGSSLSLGPVKIQALGEPHFNPILNSSPLEQSEVGTTFTNPASPKDTLSSRGVARDLFKKAYEYAADGDFKSVEQLNQRAQLVLPPDRGFDFIEMLWDASSDLTRAELAVRYPFLHSHEVSYLNRHFDELLPRYFYLKEQVDLDIMKSEQISNNLAEEHTYFKNKDIKIRALELTSNSRRYFHSEQDHSAVLAIIRDHHGSVSEAFAKAENSDPYLSHLKSMVRVNQYSLNIISDHFKGHLD